MRRISSMPNLSSVSILIARAARLGVQQYALSAYCPKIALDFGQNLVYLRRTKGEHMPGSLSFFETLPQTKLVGIARLASLGDSIKQGHKIEYFTLPTRSILNRCTSKRSMPFTWT